MIHVKLLGIGLLLALGMAAVFAACSGEPELELDPSSYPPLMSPMLIGANAGGSAAGSNLRASAAIARGARGPEGRAPTSANNLRASSAVARASASA